MDKRFKLYYNLITNTENCLPTWDIVVLTAADKNQKVAFEKQLELTKPNLPKQSKYIVVEDPPQYKIGNGGSTLEVLSVLSNLHGADWDKLKVLIVHAGGYSQRFPSASCLGKAFVSLPRENVSGLFNMLQMKLVSYVEFPSKISSGGVFVSSSDTIETYDDFSQDWIFSPSGVTALGIPSSLDVAVGHGVFVLNKKPSENGSLSYTCSKFLHKPSVEIIENEGAVLSKSEQFAEKRALTDSAFFMSNEVCSKLLKYYKTVRPLRCELDAYGDFLQALGTDSSKEYVNNTKNVVQRSRCLVTRRTQVYEILKGTELNVIALAALESTGECKVWSEFCHVGTFKEYISHLCCNGYSSLIEQLKLQRTVNCNGCVYKYSRKKICNDKQNDFPKNNFSLQYNVTQSYNLSCLMSSKIGANVTVGEKNVIEYSVIGENSTIGNGCVISGCRVPSDTVLNDNLFLHTIPVVSENFSGYATIVMSTKDDTKTNKEVKWGGKSLLCTSKENRPLTAFCGDEKILVPCPKIILSLWEIKLFQVCKTSENSFIASLSAYNRQIAGETTFEKEDNDLPLLSMKDVISMKNIDLMLEERMSISNKAELMRKSPLN